MMREWDREIERKKNKKGKKKSEIIVDKMLNYIAHGYKLEEIRAMLELALGCHECGFKMWYMMMLEWAICHTLTRPWYEW